MPFSQLAAVCLRYGALCVLTTLSLLCSPFASAADALTISGAPPTTATVGAAYSFQPTTSDPRGLPVTYKIYNKPSWASFDTATGRLYGTPQAGNVGAYGWVQIAGSDGQTTSWLPAYTLTVSGSSSGSSSSQSTGGGSAKLAIGGTPPTTATVGSAYSFQPTVSAPGGETVTFNVYNKPAWATFNSATGRLYGTPSASNIGTYRWVQVAASCGGYTSWLSAYTITVSASSTTPTTGSVTVSWMPPTQNTNGTTLTNLAGYNIYYGTSGSSLNNVVKLTNPGLTTYVLSNLAAGTWYFAMTAVNSIGQESPRSNEMSHSVE
jgi:hypothetical protein